MKPLGRAAPAVFLVLLLAGPAWAFPTWMGVYGTHERHSAGNPGEFTVLMNADYWGLQAEVGVRIGGGPFRTHAMTYVGMGHYTRSATEFVLLFSRGKPFGWADRCIPQVLYSVRGEHSRKPDRVRQYLERAYPEAHRLEMFARERAHGWDAWGAETDKFGWIERPGSPIYQKRTEAP